MDLLFIVQLARAALREFWQHRYTALISGFVIALGVLAFGMFWQEKYSVSSTLYADRQNIIAPLLKGQAEVTEVEDQLQIVKDLMLSQEVLEKIVSDQALFGDISDPAKASVIANSLRDNVTVRSLGKNYIGVSFADVSPDRAYGVVTQLVDLFIKESSADKRSESKQAFLFIDKQVNSYKEQLRQAEEKLKQFNASNVDGTEGRILGNIESLRTEISDLELDLGQTNERVTSLKQEVSQEDRYLTKKARSEEFRERLAEAVAQLDDLRLAYTDNHPDVIAMKEHIQALRNAASGGSDDSIVDIGISSGTENPVYDELRSSLAAAQVEKSAMSKRLEALRDRLERELVRAKRIAEREAELSELTRDYDVTKGLYEDLLNRKEQARLSMTLDIEGQGVTYKIQAPAKYPLSPSGLRFVHFVLLGCLIGIAVPIGLIVAYVFLDPRIRFPSMLEQEFEVVTLGVVPHLTSSPMQRMRKTDFRVFFFFAVLCAVVYALAAAAFLVLG